MITVGLVIKGRTEVMWYGRELSSQKAEDLTERYGSVENIQILDPCHDFFTGLLIRDHQNLSPEEIEIKYFFPEEEDPDQLPPERVVDLSLVRVMPIEPRRKKSDQGQKYLCGGEVGPGRPEIMHFESGYLPPFNPGDITLFVADLTDHGLKASLLTDVTYLQKKPDYSEQEAGPAKRLKSRILED